LESLKASEEAVQVGLPIATSDKWSTKKPKILLV
jgi:hypothetical protein